MIVEVFPITKKLVLYVYNIKTNWYLPRIDKSENISKAYLKGFSCKVVNLLLSNETLVKAGIFENMSSGRDCRLLSL